MPILGAVTPTQHAFAALFRVYCEAVREHCPEGFGGGLEHDGCTDRILFRIRSDGIDGSVTKSLDMRELREMLELGFPLHAYPAKRDVIAARDHLMEQTLPCPKS